MTEGNYPQEDRDPDLRPQANRKDRRVGPVRSFCRRRRKWETGARNPPHRVHRGWASKSGHSVDFSFLSTPRSTRLRRGHRTSSTRDPHPVPTTSSVVFRCPSYVSKRVVRKRSKGLLQFLRWSLNPRHLGYPLSSETTLRTAEWLIHWMFGEVRRLGKKHFSPIIIIIICQSPECCIVCDKFS